MDNRSEPNSSEQVMRDPLAEDNHMVVLRSPSLSSVITEPVSSDREKLLDQITRGYYLRNVDTHEPTAFNSNFHLDGVVSTVFSERSLADETAIHAAAAHEIKVETVRITGLWDFFQECASCGFEGVLLDNYYPVTFYNRLTDMDRTIPTLMWMRFPGSTNELKGFFFGRFGVVNPESGTTVKWGDYPKFDKASIRHVLFDNPLPEPIEAHVITDERVDELIFPMGASFLGPYVSDPGAIPVFSSKQWAEYFARITGLMIHKQGDFQLAEGYSIVRVDLSKFLDQVFSNHGPFLDVGLNSLCHRYRQGWFFRHQDKWMLETISGVWDVFYGDVQLRPDISPPKGHLGTEGESSLITSGVTTVVETPFKRITGADRTELSDEDAVAVIDQHLSVSFEPQSMADKKQIPVDAFVIEAFETITGESIRLSTMEDANTDLGFLVFPDLLAAAAYLIHEILPHDENIRLNGYHTHAGGNSPGTGDPDRESRITTSIDAAIRKILFNALVNGYKPEHGLFLMRLMQDAVKTFEITEIGYFGDLLFYGMGDGSDVWDRVLFDDKTAIQRIKSAKNKLERRLEPSPALKSQLKKSLGSAYDMLTAESRVIAASALEEFNQTGMKTGYDYSGISMKVSKLIERELNIRIFRPWRDQMRDVLEKDCDLTEPDSNERIELFLNEWLQKRSKIGLGDIRHCLNAVRNVKTATTLFQSFTRYIHSMPEGDWLISPELESVINDISTKYRNGGVHEHTVSFETCQEAINRILLGPRPLLQRLMMATNVDSEL